MRRTAALALAALFALTACGDGTADKSGDKLTGPFTASGSFGEAPTLTFPQGPPPPGLVKLVTSEGTGPQAQQGDLMVAHYVGQIWNGKVFDSSYEKGDPADFALDQGRIVDGWLEGLTGVKAGSRVLLSVPPDKGYKAEGRQQAGISGTDTLAFVIDVIGTYPRTTGLPDGAVEQDADTQGVEVTGKLTEQPKVVIPKGTPEPKKEAVVTLAKGTGSPISGGLVLLQFESVDWTNAPSGSSWAQDGLYALRVGDGSPLDALVGVPVGSRVLVLLPASTEKGSAHPALAIVADLVAAPTAPK